MSYLLRTSIDPLKNNSHPQEFFINIKINKKRRSRLISVADGSILREVISPRERTKLDTTDDRLFYSIPRLVHHSDLNFRDQLTELYRQRIPPDSEILDLCSSWTSHLPDDVSYSKIVGHGMNAVELGRNERLSQFFVRDLNKDTDTNWSIKDNSFDAVLCCCSIQYLQYPEHVFAEIHRVLKPGGICIIAFTHNLFYDKAITIWRDGTKYSRVQLVKSYFSAISGFSEPECITEVDITTRSSSNNILKNTFKGFMRAFEDQMASFRNTLGSEKDPFYAVISYKTNE